MKFTSIGGLRNHSFIHQDEEFKYKCKECGKVFGWKNQWNINARDYRRGNQNWTIQRNWQHSVHKMKKNQMKTQHNMCWTPLYANKHK
jgi:hypothetical protein